MALSHPYSVQQNQLLKEEMNFQKSDMNHALVKYSTTTMAATLLLPPPHSGFQKYMPIRQPCKLLVWDLSIHTPV